MIPFFFGQSHRRIFGLYHPPPANCAFRGAVVLCQPLGTEFINAHRAMRQLAIMLSNAGFHVLRFDYYGTGDSEGESQTITADDLVKDIGLAIDELCSICHCERVGFFHAREASGRFHWRRPPVKGKFLDVIAR